MDSEPRYKLTFVVFAVNLQSILEVLDGCILGPAQVERIDPLPTDPLVPRAPRPPQINNNSHRQRRRQGHRSENGESAASHLLTMMRGSEVWSTNSIIKGLRRVGFKGKSTGPSILSVGMRTGHIERLGDALYRLTESGKSTPIPHIVKALNTERNKSPLNDTI